MNILCVSSRTPCLVENGEIWFITQRKGTRLTPWQHLNGCHFVSYLAYTLLVPSLNSVTVIFPEIFLILGFIFELKLFVTFSSVFGTREDVQTKKMPSLFSLKGLSNRHRLFFSSYAR